MSNGKITFKGYIVGEGRSGTTLFSAMLNRHSGICVTPETHFYRWISLYPEGVNGFISSYPNSLREIFDKMRNTSGWVPDPEPIISKFPTISSSKDISCLFLDMGDRIAQAANKRSWLEKSPNHIRDIQLIDQIHPQQKIIFIVRDGRAVAESLSRMDWASDIFIENCLRWVWTMRLYQRYLRKRKNTLTIRYEDLINNTELTLERVCEFLEICYEPSMLKQSPQDRHLIEAGDQHKNKIMGKIDPSNIDLWRNKVSDENITYSERLLGYELNRWGYSTNSTLFVTKNKILISPFPPSDRTNTILEVVVRDLFQKEADLWLFGTINIGEKIVGLPSYWIQFEEILSSRYCEQENENSDIYFSIALFNLTRILLNKNTRFVLYYHPQYYNDCQWRKKRLIVDLAIKAAWKIIVPDNDYTGLENSYGNIATNKKYSV
jgi:hypothetical protein